MLVGAPGGRPAARGAVEEAELQEVGLVDVLDGVGLLGDGRSQGVHADRPAPELVDDGQKESAVHLVEAVGVDLEQRQGVRGRPRA